MRSTFKVGLPLLIGKNFFYQYQIKNKSEALEYRLKFHREVQKIVKNENQDDGLKMQVYSKILFEAKYQKMLQNDSKIIMLGSSVFFIIYVTIFTKSIFQAAIGILTVFLTYGSGQIFYAYVFQIDYYTNVHVLALVCIQGIYGDFLFNMADLWYYSGQVEKYKDLESNRLAYTWKKSFLNLLHSASIMICVLVVSFELSPSIPVRAFAIHLGILMLIINSSSILIVPSAIIWE